jgi:cysteine desulfurase/selenocysteine lyase
MNSLNVQRLRKDFPILKKKVNGHNLIYFDSAATSQKPKQVIDGIKYFYENLNSNPLRSIHYLAERATEAYSDARDKVAKFINAAPEEIVFVRNTTEAINLLSFALPLAKDDIVATTYLEHHSNLLPWFNLRNKGVMVEIVDVDKNMDLDLSYYEDMSEKTKLVTLSHESNVSGTINDAKKISRIAHKKGAMVLVDAAQSVPHLPVDVKELDVDFLAFSGHKMLGPFGIGVLYVRKSISNQLSNFLSGGEMIKSVRLNDVVYADLPNRFEAGTQNIEGAYGLGLAIDYLNAIGMRNVEKYGHALALELFEKMGQIKGLEIYGGKSRNFGATAAFNVKGLHSHDVAYFLDKKGIAIRSGFHCAQPFVEDKLRVNGACRASLYLYNTSHEIDTFCGELKKIVNTYGRG